MKIECVKRISPWSPFGFGEICEIKNGKLYNIIK